MLGIFKMFIHNTQFVFKCIRHIEMIYGTNYTFGICVDSSYVYC